MPIHRRAQRARTFFWFYFINEQVLRYLNRRVPRDYDTVPLLLFWGLLAVWLMPWIAFVFKAIVPVRMRSSLRRVRLPRHDQAWNLLGIWAAFVMVFFSFSTRQEYYALPALPPIALMIGGWLGREEKCSARDSAPHRRTPHRHGPVSAGCGGLRDCGLPGDTCPTLLPQARIFPPCLRKIPEITRSHWVIFSI